MAYSCLKIIEKSNIYYSNQVDIRSLFSCYLHFWTLWRANNTVVENEMIGYLLKTVVSILVYKSITDIFSVHI